MQSHSVVLDNDDVLSNTPISIGIEKYVAQLERRVLEQEQLIQLLNEKILFLEATPAAVKHDRLKTSVPINSYAATLSSENPERYDSRNRNSFTGSRVTTISSVSSVKNCQFFVSRIDPSVSAHAFAQDMLSTSPELSSLRCVKLKTRYSSYTSFHVTVPDDKRDALSSGDSWPQGSLVKVFTGKLLPSYILEEFNTDVPMTSPPSSSSTAKKVGRQSKLTPSTSVNSGGKSKSNVVRNSGPTTNTKVPSSKISKPPNASPKNLRLTRSTLNR